MITVLCVRKDSIYKKLGCDCYDRERDMNTWSGGNGIIAHPPCAQWGRFKGQATMNAEEKQLAITCADLVRKNGGIIEHPAVSALFGYPSSETVLPMPGLKDEWGGYSICINQSWFGHRALKKTLLYIVGCEEKNLPPIPYSLDAIQATIGWPVKKNGARRFNGKRPLSKGEHDKTPIDLARWLMRVTEPCGENFVSSECLKRNRLCRDATGEE